jgi:hypothetical protein
MLVEITATGVHPEVSPEGAAAEGLPASFVEKLRSGNTARHQFLDKIMNLF